jgi:hypothetical protein
MQTFCFDKLVAMAAQTQPHLPNGPDRYLSITTPWPRPLVDYETVRPHKFFCSFAYLPLLGQRIRFGTPLPCEFI